MIRNGSVVRIIGDIPNTNGLAFSPDEKVLYANGSIDNYIRRYDVLADGTVANGRMFADLRDETGIGITDGMRVDETGNLWSTGPGGVWIISPEGTRLGRIPLPEGGTNLVFGGADRKTVFVSCPTTIYRIDTIVAGAR
jgi:gluconolactonase